MADVIARFKADTSGFTGGLKQVNRTFNELIDGISRTGRSIAQADKQEIEFVRSLGQMKTVSQSARGKLSELTGAFTDLKFRYNSLTEAEKKTPLGKELANSLDKLKGRIKETRTELEGINKELNGGKGGMFAGLDFKSIASSAVGFTGVAGAAIMAVNTLKGAIEGNIRTAIDFEQANANLASVLGTTRSEITALTEDAKALGASTMFTASEVSNLQTELAKLGFTQKEIKNSTAAILDFSAATGAGLGEAAALAGASLRAFGLDAQEMTRVVSAMAVGTTKSALDFSYLQTAMSTVAPVAHQFGFEIEDVVTLLGTLANSGFDASSAATATRNILLYLADDSSKLSKALGGGVHSIEDFARGVKQLNIDGTQLAEMLDMTDKRAVAAFATFVSGADKILELRDGVTDCDEALRKMVDERMDTMEGSLKTLSSAWEGLNLAINDDNGLLRDGVEALTAVVNAMKGCVDWVNQLKKDTQEFGSTANHVWENYKTTLLSQIPVLGQLINTFRSYWRAARGEDVSGGNGGWEGEVPSINKPNEVNDVARTGGGHSSSRHSGGGHTGGRTGTRTYSGSKNTEHYATDSIRAQQKEVERLRQLWESSGASVRDNYKVQLDAAQATLDKMMGKGTEKPAAKKKDALVPVTQSLGPLQLLEEELKTVEGSMKNAANTDEWKTMSDYLETIKNQIKSFKGEITPVVSSTKEAGKAWQVAAQAINSAGSALQNMDNKGAKVAGIVAQAVANIALGFAQASASPATGASGVFGWIAAATAGLATMTATIASIKQSTKGFAEGGILGGQNYSGDLMPARVNSGEMIINQSDQKALYDAIHSGNIGGAQTIHVVTRGENTFYELRNYMRRTNKTL